MNIKHRIPFLLSLLVFLAFFSACETQTAPPDNSEPEESAGFSISSARLDAVAADEAFGLRMEYPVLHAPEHPAMERAINDAIHALALSYYQEDELEDSSLETSYECNILHDRFLSVALYSESYHRGDAHPTLYTDTLLYDLSSGEQLSIESIVETPANLPALILDGTFQPDASFLEGGNVLDMDLLAALLDSQTVGAQFYLSPTGLALIVEVPRALGDWFRFSADYSDIPAELTPAFQAFLDEQSA